ncbi:MAG: site-2 protease family protein [Planctomycetes bacterium]|nr:site-2 protease family protein [Planctomycetota bacterium]
MFLAEPPRTQFDLNFSLFGFPVRVSPWFWLLGIVLGANATGGSANTGIILLICISSIFLSILVHELGHAFMFRRFGQPARIVLTMMGGLAIPDSSPFDSGNGGGKKTSSRQQIIISAAGPIAGFMLAGLVIGLVYLGGGEVAFRFGKMISSDGFTLPWQVTLPTETSPYLQFLVHILLFFNIFWGIMNLLPVYPLDGGQISREIFVSKDPWEGLKKSLWVSVITGAIVAGLGLLVFRQIFLGVMFGFLAFGSYQVLQQIGGRGGGFGGGGRGGYGSGGRPW